MKEIGGYIELDTYHLPMLHEDAIALNCGRNALAYLLKARGIKKLWIPRFICASVPNVCAREDVDYEFYKIGFDFLPSEELNLKENEWFYFVNYYSQFDNETINEYVKKYKRVIVDQAHSYFQNPIQGVDTLYTCRKYFGVPDGAFLYTDVKTNQSLIQDESFERMHFLLGRFERSASEFYTEYVFNNNFFQCEPVKKMSRLTLNLLHGIDYGKVERIRMENFSYLHECLKNTNLLSINNIKGTFMYPLMIENGARIRKRLQEVKIYIPTLWPDVLNSCEENSDEYNMAKNILPLPIDQRYGINEMNIIVEEILR